MNIFFSLTTGFLFLFFLAGCQPSQSGQNNDGRFKVVLQTDWYPQPEHGGFYQALVEGYYAEEGLDVEILPGGPNTVSLEKVALGQVQFAMGKSNDVLMHISRGVPVIMVGALLQHDPQALLFHQENPIRDFSDLDGKRIMAGPGSAFLELIRRKYQVQFDLLPLDYGIGQFLRDKEFIQQCFITSEPYFAEKQGANPGAILIRESGFDPYHVWYTRSDFVQKHPDIVEKFSRATIKGWQNYLFGDRTRTNELLKSLSPKLNDAFIAYSVGALLEYGLVTGVSGDASVIGTMDPGRIQTEIAQLSELNILKKPVTLEQAVYDRYLTHPGELAFRNHSKDLEIVIEGESPASIRQFITREFLESLPHEFRPFTFTQKADPLAAKVVFLTSIFKALKIEPGEYGLLVNCGDQYQSNFGPTAFDSQKPYLVLEIDGLPTAEWAASKNNPDWGPYIIGIADERNLKDPGGKQPWGVTQLILQPKATYLESLHAHWPNPLSERGQAGRTLFIDNCLNCHALDETVGGHVSNRTVQILAAHAKSNPAYIRQMIYEPEKAFPDGIRMPAMLHYTGEDIRAVVEFLSAYSD